MVVYVPRRRPLLLRLPHFRPSCLCQAHPAMRKSDGGTGIRAAHGSFCRARKHAGPHVGGLGGSLTVLSRAGRTAPAYPVGAVQCPLAVEGAGECTNSFISASVLSFHASRRISSSMLSISGGSSTCSGQRRRKFVPIEPSTAVRHHAEPRSVAACSGGGDPAPVASRPRGGRRWAPHRAHHALAAAGCLVACSRRRRRRSSSHAAGPAQHAAAPHPGAQGCRLRQGRARGGRGPTMS